jgi:hypothetical protein
MNRLTVGLSQAGKYTEAEPVARSALRFAERVLGQEHPQTLATQINLAWLLIHRGALEQAGALMHRGGHQRPVTVHQRSAAPQQIENR